MFSSFSFKPFILKICSIRRRYRVAIRSIVNVLLNLSWPAAARRLRRCGSESSSHRFSHRLRTSDVNQLARLPKHLGHGARPHTGHDRQSRRHGLDQNISKGFLEAGV